MAMLNWKLLTKKRESSTQGLPPGKENLAWVTNTVTLIYGERDAATSKSSSAFAVSSAECFERMVMIPLSGDI